MMKKLLALILALTLLLTGTAISASASGQDTVIGPAVEGEAQPLGAALPRTVGGTGLKSGELARAKLSKQQIAQLLKENPLTMPSDELFDEQPSVTAPYAAGKVKTEVLQLAVNRLNMTRMLAGLPSVTLDGELSANAQYGAVLLSASDFSHYPAQPEDMDDDFYQKGRSATSSSNIAGGYTLVEAVDCFMADNDAYNIDRMGHRRWQLYPPLGKVGFGYALGGVYRRYTCEKVFDRSGSYGEYEFIAWPASGYFPNELFGSYDVWTISLNGDLYSRPSISEVSVTLTRQSDGKQWSFSGSDYTPSGYGEYYNIDTGGYGISNCIIFRPAIDTDYAGLFTVNVEGLKDRSGKAVSFSYEVEFFDPEKLGEEPDPGPVKGDANGDGVTDARDSILLEQKLVGWAVSLDEAAADVTGDDRLDGRDAILLAQYLAGWPVTLN